MPDKITVTVLENGQLKIETDTISLGNHVLAERLLQELCTLAGGEVTRKNKKGYAEHSHGQGQGFHAHH